MNWSEKLIELEAKTRIPDGSPFAMNELAMFLCKDAREIAALVEAAKTASQAFPVINIELGKALAALDDAK